jgi:hypothetical protein
MSFSKNSVSRQEDNISLFIPHIFPQYDVEFIRNIFQDYGIVDRIDLVPKEAQDGHYYNSAYIHFVSWHFTAKAEEFKKQVIQGKENNRVYYQDKWYWICLPNKSKKNQIPFIKNQRKIVIDLSGMNEQEKLEVHEKQEVHEEYKEYEEYEEQDQEVQDEIYLMLEQEDQEQDEISQILEEEEQEKISQILEEQEQEEISQILEEQEQEEITQALEQEESEDLNLITIDGRYVEVLENENLELRYQIELLNNVVSNLSNLLNIEKIKVRELFPQPPILIRDTN